MTGSTAGLDRKLRAHLEKLDMMSSFCSCAGSLALDDLEKDLETGTSCSGWIKLDDLMKDLNAAGGGEPVERRRGPSSAEFEVFCSIFGPLRPEKLEDLKRDFEKMLGPSASESCRDGIGTVGSDLGTDRLARWSAEVEELSLVSRWGLLSDCRSMDEKVRDLEKCLEFAVGFGGSTDFAGGVVWRENSVFGLEGCWGL